MVPPRLSRHPRVPWFRSPWFLGGWIVLAIALIYANSMQGAWIYDDYSDILNNPSIQKLWPPKELFTTTVDGRLGTQPRPLVSLSFALNFMIGRNDTLVFHLTNVGIHILAALAFFALLRQILRKDPVTARSTDLLAFLIALLWGIHPLQTEAVAYITQRYESLMTLLVMLTLLCVTLSTRSRRAYLWHMSATVCCLLALASKEVAVSLPILVLLFDRAFLSGSFQMAWRSRRWLYGAFLVAWALFAWNQLHVNSRTFAGAVVPIPWWQYAMNQPAVILHYLRLSFWPHPLVLDYFWRPAATLPPLIPGFLVIGALLVGTSVHVIRNTAWGFLGALFFLILAPTSSVLPILDLAVEHRMYLPLAPVLTVLVLGVHRGVLALNRWRPSLAGPLRAALLALGASVIGLLCSLTYIRSDDYRSSLNIWLDTVIKRPDNPRAHANYAHALQAAGFLDEAIRQQRMAVALSPANVTMRGNLGSFLAFKKQYPEAIQELEVAGRLNPKDPRPWMNLGMIYTTLKQFDRAHAYLQKAIELNPRFAFAHYSLGLLYSQQEDWSRALEQFREATRLQPGFSLSHWGIAKVLVKLGRAPEALPEFDEYVNLEANHTQARIVAGRTLVEHGYVQEGFRYWREVLRREPNNVATMLLMSWTLSTHPQASFRNGAEALSLAESALRHSNVRSAAILEAMGAAYAELGRFTEACAVTEEAITRLNANRAADVSPLTTRLAGFRRGEPYREDPAVSVH